MLFRWKSARFPENTYNLLKNMIITVFHCALWEYGSTRSGKRTVFGAENIAATDRQDGENCATALSSDPESEQKPETTWHLN